MTKVKICGLTSPKEAVWLNENQIEMAGMVLFFPKSKRNISIERAETILSALDKNIKSVAVVVSPSIQQAEVLQELGFDYIQIHGAVEDFVIEQLRIPFLKAFNVKDMKQYQKYQQCENCAGYVFDAQTPGSGKPFDWTLLRDIPRDDKLFILAGGLFAGNAAEAVREWSPDGVDVSSGVEQEDGRGKDPDKIKAFVGQIRGCQ